VYLCLLVISYLKIYRGHKTSKYIEIKIKRIKKKNYRTHGEISFNLNLSIEKEANIYGIYFILRTILKN
jgi:hypothetical protein